MEEAGVSPPDRPPGAAERAAWCARGPGGTGVPPEHLSAVARLVDNAAGAAVGRPSRSSRTRADAMPPHRTAYRPAVAGFRGVVTSAHYLATEAGVEMLLYGGNA